MTANTPKYQVNHTHPTGDLPGKLMGMQMTIVEAATALGVSTNTIRRRLTSGLLTGEKNATGKWLVEVDELPAGKTPESGLENERSLIAALEARITAQENELQARRQEIQQLHTLMAARSLESGQHRRWWAFWR